MNRLSLYGIMLGMFICMDGHAQDNPYLNDFNSFRRETKANYENFRDEANKQYADFVEAFPNVKPEDIPKEVFENAQSSNLVAAYKDWLIKDLETKLQIKEQNEMNEKSAIGSVTETGTTKKQEPTDLFLEGFDSN